MEILLPGLVGPKAEGFAQRVTVTSPLQPGQGAQGMQHCTGGFSLVRTVHQHSLLLSCCLNLSKREVYNCNTGFLLPFHGPTDRGPGKWEDSLRAGQGREGQAS